MNQTTATKNKYSWSIQEYFNLTLLVFKGRCLFCLLPFNEKTKYKLVNVYKP